MFKQILAFCITVVAASLAQPTHAQDETTFIRTSQYIFEGTVLKLHSSNVSLLPASGQTVLVHIDSMLRGPQGMNFSGKDITLYLKSDSQLRLKQRSIFFANGWLYGANVALRSVGQIPPKNLAAFKERIAQVDGLTADEALLVRLRAADLVIEGRILDTKIVREEEGRRSEHETGWALAQVEVAAVLKGDKGAVTGAVPVYFPTSADELWYLSPKFSKGQKGLFILQSASAKRYGLKGYAALDPLDFRPIEDLERVSRLIQRTR